MEGGQQSWCESEVSGGESRRLRCGLSNCGRGKKTTPLLHAGAMPLCTSFVSGTSACCMHYICVGRSVAGRIYQLPEHRTDLCHAFSFPGVQLTAKVVARYWAQV